MELVAGYSLLAAAVLGLTAWVWLLVVAFRKHRGWGVALLFPPTAVLIGPVFVLTHLKRSIGPVVLFVLGLLAAAPYGWILYTRESIDLGPRETLVEGERHITLTGWDREDYSLLRSRPDVVVLQMANPDVTDETLTYLTGMKKLRELDLDDTRITDEGLALLARLPALRSIRLAGTAITDDGFRKHLADKDTLRELDLRRTRVASKTVRDWKARGTDRKALR